MSKFSFLILCLGFLCASSVEGYCARCIEANRNNASNPNQTFYYEDYLDARANGGQVQPQAPRR